MKKQLFLLFLPLFSCTNSDETNLDLSIAERKATAAKYETARKAVSNHIRKLYQEISGTEIDNDITGLELIKYISDNLNDDNLISVC